MPALIHSNELTYHSETKTLSGEVSDIGAAHAEILGMRLTNGLSVMSSRTGVVTDWEFREELKDDGGETVGWVFIPTLATWTKTPTVAGHKLVIFND
jgi:hypothetical protein